MVNKPVELRTLLISFMLLMMLVLVQKTTAKYFNGMVDFSLSVYSTVFVNLVAFQIVSAAIDCFKCVSLNHGNPACDDPFHNNYTRDILESPCMGGRKGRNGLFPATACIKLTGTYDDTGDHIMVRGCALDSGTLTTDTEIIRMSHCGGFYFNDRYVRGCLQSCDDGDACNRGPSLRVLRNPTLVPLIIGSTFLFL